MTEKIGYKLNPKKLKGAPQSILPYFCGAFYYTEDFEYFDVIKPYLDIPEPPKSLEEIQQELEEKIDKLIEDTKTKFYGSKIYAESRYERNFDKIFDNFEYAKKHGQFPVRLTVGKLDCSTLGVSSAVDWSTEYRIGTNVVGYWDIKPNIKVYLEKKPNSIVRYFTKLLLDFTWKDK
jgi:hypothetical protein